MEAAINSWEFNPKEILLSSRKVKGIFHKPMIDKDGEFITADAIRKSIPDFMHLPALHDFHKERPVGIATKIMELSGGKFFFEGVIKATQDCDDIWEKISSGNYDQVSIFGKRTAYNNNCSLPQNMRSGPCITDGVRLDSISVCDENARNPQTSLEVQKAKVLFDAQTIIKAEDSSSSLMHTATDYAGKKRVRVSVEKAVEPEREKSIDFSTKKVGPHTVGLKLIDRAKNKKPIEKCPCKREEPNTISKEDDDVTDDIEKGKNLDSMGRNYVPPKITEEPVPPKERKESQNTKIRPARPGEKFEKAEEDMEKSEEEGVEKGRSDREPKTFYTPEGSNTESDHAQNKRFSAMGKRTGEIMGSRTTETRKNDAAKHDKHHEESAAGEGMRSLHKSEEEEVEKSEEEPVEKAEEQPVEKAEDKPEEPKKQTKGKPSEADEKQEKEEDEYEEEEEEVEKSRAGNMIRAKKELREKNEKHDLGPVENRGQADAAAHEDQKRSPPRSPDAAKKQFNKNSNKYMNARVQKSGEPMEEKENDVEYVTKALVPIEEIDTIVKARTEEISKAYMGQLEEIKKAYDAKFVELSSKVEKMEQETIRKGGNVVVIPELLKMSGEAATSNADAIARMQAGRT